MTYLKLFWIFFQIGLLSFGGGYAAMPLIQNHIVQINHYLSMSEFTDLIIIAEMTPGPIAINSASFVGMQLAGFAGAIILTLGCILPSCIIVSTLAYCYYKYRDLKVVKAVLGGLRPAVVAMIASAGLSILVVSFWGEHGFSLALGDINIISVILFCASLFVLRKYKPSPILVMAGAGLAGAIPYLLT